MKSVIGLLCLVLAAGCTDPQETSFRGTITEKVTVTDVFVPSKTIYLTVDENPGATTELACVDQASVSVTASTKVSWSDAPGTPVSADGLDVGQFVRVLPPSDPRDSCPMMINATAVVIVR